jgi:hypothetical protein
MAGESHSAAEAEIAVVAHGTSSRLQRPLLDFVPEIDEHVAKADEVELAVAGRRPRRKDVVAAKAHLLAQQRTDFVEAVVA